MLKLLLAGLAAAVLAMFTHGEALTEVRMVVATTAENIVRFDVPVLVCDNGDQVRSIFRGYLQSPWAGADVYQKLNRTMGTAGKPACGPQVNTWFILLGQAVELGGFKTNDRFMTRVSTQEVRATRTKTEGWLMQFTTVPFLPVENRRVARE